MNIDRLRAAEAEFLGLYPEGFRDPGLARVGRRHKVAQLSERAQEVLAPRCFARQGQVLDDAVRIISRSSMISLFEKPKFRDWVAGLERDARETLVIALKRLLHGTGRSPQRGFESFVELLLTQRLAKWSLVTALPYYLHPMREVFVKPTTTKGVIAFFELDVPPYRPTPSWSFYEAYRAQLFAMRDLVHPSLAPNNAAFSGFLMMSTGFLNPAGAASAPPHAARGKRQR